MLWTRAAEAINVFDAVLVITLLFQLLAKHSSAALPCKRFHVLLNNLSLASQL